MSTLLLVLAILAAGVTVVLGVMLNFANMMSDAAGVQMTQWPLWTVGGAATVGLLAARHYLT